MYLSDLSIGDKATLTSKCLEYLKTTNLIKNLESWKQILVIEKIYLDREGVKCSYPIRLRNSAGNVLHFDLDEIVVEKTSAPQPCRCQITVLMNRGCQCGAPT